MDNGRSTKSDVRDVTFTCVVDALRTAVADVIGHLPDITRDGDVRMLVEETAAVARLLEVSLDRSAAGNGNRGSGQPPGAESPRSGADRGTREPPDDAGRARTAADDAEAAAKEARTSLAAAEAAKDQLERSVQASKSLDALAVLAAAVALKAAADAQHAAGSAGVAKPAGEKTAPGADPNARADAIAALLRGLDAARACQSRVHQSALAARDARGRDEADQAPSACKEASRFLAYLSDIRSRVPVA
jgi:hypothetical protein